MTTVTKIPRAAAGIGALLVAGALPLFAPGAAQATPGPLAGTCAGDDAKAIGCFEDNGDHVLVHDAKADGLRPAVRWQADYPRVGQCTYKGNSEWTDCDYDLLEGRIIHFDVLLVDGAGDIVERLGSSSAEI